MEGNIKKSQIRTMAKDLELSRPVKNILNPSPLTQEKGEQENKTKESKQPRELRTEPKPEIKPAAKNVLPQPSPALASQSRAELDEPKEERKLSEILAEARKRVSQTKPALGGQAPPASPKPESITTTQKSIPPTSPTRAEAEPSDKTKPPTQKVTETRTGEVKKPDKTAVSPKTLDDLLPIEPSYAPPSPKASEGHGKDSADAKALADRSEDRPAARFRCTGLQGCGWTSVSPGRCGPCCRSMAR